MDENNVNNDNTIKLYSSYIDKFSLWGQKSRSVAEPQLCLQCVVVCDQFSFFFRLGRFHRQPADKSQRVAWKDWTWRLTMLVRF